MEHSVQNYEMATFSKLLQMTMLDAQAFSKAVEQEIIVINSDGTLKWMLESKTLLAYFCGRMWCGDVPFYSTRAKGYIWQFGGKRFPRKELVALFGVKNLRTLRKQRNMGLLPENWEVVESFFSINFQSGI